jgi:acetylornithine deacetylase/succinyl-diaminopimelate desuccinylase-like protein
MTGGASHSPQEYSSDEDIELAVDVLTSALRRIARSPGS